MLAHKFKSPHKRVRVIVKLRRVQSHPLEDLSLNKSEKGSLKPKSLKMTSYMKNLLFVYREQTPMDLSGTSDVTPYFLSII